MSKEVQPKGRLWSKDYIIICLAYVAISYRSYSLTSPLEMLAESITGTVAYSGILGIMSTIASLTTRQLIGPLVDRTRRSRVYTIGCAFALVSASIFLFSNQLPIMMFGMLLQGIGNGMISTTGGAMIADVVAPDRRVEALGYYTLANSLATAIGPSTGMYLTLNLGYSALFRFTFLMILIPFLLSMTISYEKEGKGLTPAQRAAMKHTTPERIIRGPGSRMILGVQLTAFLPAAVMMMVGFTHSTILNYMPQFALSKGFTSTGYFFTVLAAAMFITRAFAGKISAWIGEERTVILSLIIYMITFPVLAFSDSWTLITVVAFPMGLAFGMINPNLNALIYNNTTRDRRARGSSLFYSGMDVGYGVGALLWGWVASLVGYNGVYLIAPVFCILGLFMFLWCLKLKKQETVEWLPEEACPKG